MRMVQNGDETDAIRTKRPAARRGSAISLMIMVSIVITGLVVTMAWTTGIQASAASARTRSDQAFYASEGALQWAIYKLRQDPTWRPTGTSPIVNGWTCAITYTDMGSPVGLLGNPLKFTVVATKAGVQSSAQTSGTVSGSLAYVPQFWSVGDLTIAQSAHINGDVETLGKLTINPPTSGGVQTLGVKGTVKAKGIVVDNNPGPSGSGKYFASTPVANSTSVSKPTMKATDIFNTLKAGPMTPLANCLVYVSGQPVIDFSKAGGKPVYYNGPASYVGGVGIINSSNPANDTFVIDAPGGVCNFTGTFPFNTSIAKMNLVINGDVNFNGSGAGISITGSFYVSGNWTQTGVYNFKGTIMTDLTTKLNGTGTVDVAVPPTFDPRYVPRITGFVGNLP